MGIKNFLIKMLGGITAEQHRQELQKQEKLLANAEQEIFSLKYSKSAEAFLLEKFEHREVAKLDDECLVAYLCKDQDKDSVDWYAKYEAYLCVTKLFTKEATSPIQIISAAKFFGWKNFV